MLYSHASISSDPGSFYVYSGISMYIYHRDCSVLCVYYDLYAIVTRLSAMHRPLVAKPYRITNCTVYSTAETRENEQCDQKIENVIAPCIEKVAKSGAKIKILI